MRVAWMTTVMAAGLLLAAGCIEKPSPKAPGGGGGGDADLGGGGGDGGDAGGGGEVAGGERGCQPQCDGLECGPDGCGGQCGECEGNLVCVLGVCDALAESCDDGNAVDWDGCTQGRLSEFQVNVHTADDQRRPDVAALDGGSYVVIWQSCPGQMNDYQGPYQDGSGCGIYGRIMGPGGTAGEEFRVNKSKNNHQLSPAVASGDGFAVAWLSWSSTDGWVVKAQLFDLVGNKVGDEVEGPGTDLQEEWIPAVAMAQDGGFVVVRKGVRKAGGLGLLGMWFVDKGDVVIADEEPFDVTNFNLVDLAYPRIFSVPGPEGNFLALWEQHEVGGSDWLNAWGRIVGLEEPPQFMINEMTDGAQGQPVAAIAPDGSFLALFLSDGVNEYGFGIAGRFFDNQGRARKEETRILFTGGDYEYMQPQAVVTEGGGFVMAAERSRDVAAPSQDGVVIQFRDAELERRAPDRRANLYERQFQTWPRLAALPGGEAVVVWQSCPHNPDDEFVDLPGQDGHGCGVFAQRFDSSGKRLER